MHSGLPKVVVIMPAYNAAKTLEDTYRSIPKEVVHHLILVDDKSKDNTPDVARSLGIKTIVHNQNKGYGGNQKTCYLEALADGADIVIMLHPDNQYDATKIPDLIKPLLEGTADMVIGSRLNDGKAMERGMPVWKYLSNRFLTWVENRVLGLTLTEYHSGFRAYNRNFLLTVPFPLNSDNFVFDTEMIAQAVAFGFKLGEAFTPSRYFKEASSVGFKVSLQYGLQTLLVVLQYALCRWGFRADARFSLPLRAILGDQQWQEIDAALPSSPGQAMGAAGE